jgi:hypothetical protein
MEMKPLSGAGWLRPALIGIALAYAFLAGLHTVSETDLGWQMATGRYIVQHHQIPSTTLFTYTVPGSTWIYPPFSGVIFYLLYLIGGYAALSWFSALACAATVAMAVWRGGRVTATFATLAVPAIAFRTVPRADLFTTLLFAAVLVLLVRHYEGHTVRLWLLPILMLLWVNLHHGFVAGLVLMGAYGFSEVCDMLFPALDFRGSGGNAHQSLGLWHLSSSFAAKQRHAAVNRLHRRMVERPLQRPCAPPSVQPSRSGKCGLVDPCDCCDRHTCLCLETAAGPGDSSRHAAL